MWQVLILFYFLFGTTSQLLRRVLAQKLGEHNRLINTTFFIFFLLPAALILSLFFPHNLDVGMQNLFLLLLGSLIWPIYGILSFRANKEVDVGIFTIINNLAPLFTLALAIPFLHETLQIQQYIGIGLLILSGVIAASSQLNNHNRASIQGIVTCALTAAVFGFAIVYERFMLNRIDVGAYLILGWGSQVVWSVIITGKDLKKLPKLLNKERKTILMFGATNALKAVMFILALTLSNSASLTSAATNFMSVAVVVAAYFYLKERQHMVHKMLAALIGIAGLLIISK